MRRKLLELCFLNFVVIPILPGCLTFSQPDGGGATTFQPPRHLNPSDAAVPPGYCLDIAVKGLTFPTGIVTDDKDRLYVVESGYSYGEVIGQPRLLRVDPDGSLAVIAAGTSNGPWTGAVFYKGAFYLSEGGAKDGGAILKISMDGKTERLLSGIPTMGDHQTNAPIVGPDGYLYFGVGTATNSGVIGADNAEMGWLRRHKQFHDTPCQDIELAGVNFSSDGLEEFGCTENTQTGAFVPACTSTKRGQIIRGSTLCSGAILRMPLSGGKPELVAWGFRNPFGGAFNGDGKLYVTDNSYDTRGARPIFGTGDLVWQIKPGTWYGWPDYWGTIPVTDARFAQGLMRQPTFLLAKHPNVPPKPVATLGVHASADGMDISRSLAFGYIGEAFIAMFGDMSTAGKVMNPVGFRVIRLDLKTGILSDFLVNRKTSGPASKEGSGGIERPIAARFNRDGSELYITDFGVITSGENGPKPYEGTGVVWRIKRGGCENVHGG